MDGELSTALLMGLGQAVFFAAFTYWQQRRALTTKPAETFALQVQRTHSVQAAPQEVYRALRDLLAASAEHELVDQNEDFGTLTSTRRRRAPVLGQTVSVVLQAQGGGTAVRIESRCASPTVQLDGGHNVENVEQIAEWLLERFPVEAKRATTDAARVPHRQVQTEGPG